MWYLDDGLLVGTAEALLRVLENLTSRFSDLGLKVNLTKCYGVPKESFIFPAPFILASGLPLRWF